MPAGFQVWDGGAQMMTDTSTQVGIHLGLILITSSNLSGSITVGEWAWGGITPYAHYMNAGYGGQRNIKVTISGTTLSWSAGNGSSPQPSAAVGYIIFGIR